MKRKFKTISKLPGVPIGTIFEEIPISEISILSEGYRKNHPDRHSFWYAPVGQRIPIFDVKDIEECKDVFEEIEEPITPKDIFIDIMTDPLGTAQSFQKWTKFEKVLQESDYKIIKINQSKNLKDIFEETCDELDYDSEDRECSREFLDLYLEKLKENNYHIPKEQIVD